MKTTLRLFGLILLIVSSQHTWAQGDIPLTRPIEIGTNNNLDFKSSNNSGSLLKIPSVIDKNLISKEEKKPSMMPNTNLKQAGFDLKIDTNIALSERNNSQLPAGDMYLGDFKTRDSIVGVAFRDHGEIDGDRIMILVNDEIVSYNTLLSGSYKTLQIKLKEGFNSIEFRALNQGYAGLNTAQLVALNKENEILMGNNWFLSTGSKANMMIYKEKTPDRLE
ncbi:MAG: hypothetical protein CMC18_02770 [Flavobacteriaceae bacterium]|nr:hypothetical protein [Flavobacteriaceae bacterium]